MTRFTPLLVAPLGASGVISASNKGDTTYFVKLLNISDPNSGRVFSMGKSSHGQIATGWPFNDMQIVTPTLATTITVPCQRIAAGALHAVALCGACTPHPDM